MIAVFLCLEIAATLRVAVASQDAKSFTRNSLSIDGPRLLSKVRRCHTSDLLKAF